MYLLCQDVPYSALRLLHVGGRDGVHVPTLQEFLGCARSLPHLQFPCSHQARMWSCLCSATHSRYAAVMLWGACCVTQVLQRGGAAQVRGCGGQGHPDRRGQGCSAGSCQVLACRTAFPCGQSMLQTGHAWHAWPQ